MAMRLIVTAVLAVFGTLIYLDLPRYNLTSCLHTTYSEGQEVKKEALLAVSLQPGIESPPFLIATNLAVF